MPLRIGSLEKAAAWVDEAGVAVVYASADLVLPSLWEAMAGPDADWAIRDEHGKAVDFSPEFSKLWRWKDELPEKKLACAGRHFSRGVASLVAPRLVGALYALTGRPGRPDDFRAAELDPLEGEIAEVILENGSCTGPEIRRLVGAEKRPVDSALGRLHRACVLTNAGILEQEQGWPAIKHDLFARRWGARLKRMPATDAARRSIAEALLRVGGEVSAADVAAVLRWRRKEAESILEALAGEGAAAELNEDGLRLWAAR